MCMRHVLPDGCHAATLLPWTMFSFVSTATLFGTPSVYRARGFLDVVLLAINLSAFTLAQGQLRASSSWLPFARTLFATSLAASGLVAARAVLIAKSGVFMSPDSYVL